jgi:anti-anti-sigma regulatory factor
MARSRPPDHRYHGTVVTLAGEVGLDGTSARATLLRAIQGPPQDLLVDMRRVESLSVLGVAAFVGARVRQKAVGRQFSVVCAAGSATERALVHAGLRATLTDLPHMPPQRPA